MKVSTGRTCKVLFNYHKHVPRLLSACLTRRGLSEAGALGSVTSLWRYLVSILMQEFLCVTTAAVEPAGWLRRAPLEIAQIVWGGVGGRNHPDDNTLLSSERENRYRRRAKKDLFVLLPTFQT